MNEIFKFAPSFRIEILDVSDHLPCDCIQGTVEALSTGLEAQLLQLSGDILVSAAKGFGR
ncbi:hypothetical protein [Streptomyces tubercidicus]|uniref:hypothetical protein n=1 Tax=Streptomyces tubercidicus TaxID=47759 RepID=UPI00135C104B|nr:hypothetical protein [Streptomyces tubercidicus]WAU12961.1 hypothetical protein STRTU_003390 [Streptomyces tubercidicus]